MVALSSIPSKYTELLFASTNAGKIAELQEIAAPFGITIINPQSLVSTLGPVPEVEEGVSSYHENALLKAQAFYHWAKMPCVADDAGLEVSALNGAPGVKSARFAGEHATMIENKALLLEKLRGTTERNARFRSVLCFIDGGGAPLYSEATLEGSIAESESGTGGFGYDTLLLLNGYEKTLSELKESEHIETHRVKAFKQLLRDLEQ